MGAAHLFLRLARWADAISITRGVPNRESEVKAKLTLFFETTYLLPPAAASPPRRGPDFPVMEPPRSRFQWKSFTINDIHKTIPFRNGRRPFPDRTRPETGAGIHYNHPWLLRPTRVTPT
jgi:hypothetical protein